MRDLYPDMDASGDGSTLLDAVGKLWTADWTAQALGLSEDEMAERRTVGALLGLPTSDGDYFYPVAQFEQPKTGNARVRPALHTLLTTLRAHDPWTVAVVLRTRSHELTDMTPLDWVRQKRDQRTLARYAQILDVEWSR